MSKVYNLLGELVKHDWEYIPLIYTKPKEQPNPKHMNSKVVGRWVVKTGVVIALAVVAALVILGIITYILDPSIGGPW